MKKLIALLFLILPLSAAADSFTVIGSIQDGFSGPALGAHVTICEYGNSNGFSTTAIVQESGLVIASFPYLPNTVAFEVSEDKVYEDVHVIVAEPVCVVSPCDPDQSAVFMIRLMRRLVLADKSSPYSSTNIR